MSRCLSTLPNNQVGQTPAAITSHFQRFLSASVTLAGPACRPGVHRKLGRPGRGGPLQAGRGGAL